MNNELFKHLISINDRLLQFRIRRPSAGVGSKRSKTKRVMNLGEERSWWSFRLDALSGLRVHRPRIKKFPFPSGILIGGKDVFCFVFPSRAGRACIRGLRFHCLNVAKSPFSSGILIAGAKHVFYFVDALDPWGFFFLVFRVEFFIAIKSTSLSGLKPIPARERKRSKTFSAPAIRNISLPHNPTTYIWQSLWPARLVVHHHHENRSS